MKEIALLVPVTRPNVFITAEATISQFCGYGGLRTVTKILPQLQPQCQLNVKFNLRYRRIWLEIYNQKLLTTEIADKYDGSMCSFERHAPMGVVQIHANFNQNEQHAVRLRHQQKSRIHATASCACPQRLTSLHVDEGVIG